MKDRCDADTAARRTVSRAKRELVLVNVDIDQLHALSQPLDSWRRWATGNPVSLETTADVLEILGSSNLLDRSQVQALSTPLADWAPDRGFEPEFHAPERGSSIEIGLES